MKTMLSLSLLVVIFMINGCAPLVTAIPIPSDTSAPAIVPTATIVLPPTFTLIPTTSPIPIIPEDNSADLVVSGWSVSYLAVWNPDSWESELEKWLGEMKRILRPNSYIILFESLGTGNESPIKLEHLKDYYPWLDEVGFKNKWLRTDYKFDSLEEAEFLSGFFFGDELGDKVKQHDWVVLPECTGVWWKQV